MVNHFKFIELISKT